MQLPSALRQAIERECAARPSLRAAATQLSRTYRAPNGAAPAMADADRRAAYLAVRLPATFAAVTLALDWSVAGRREQGENDAVFAPRTLLDLGSGPGTALWAAATQFPTLTQATAVEQDAALIALAQQLISAAATDAPAWLRRVDWQQADLRQRLPANQFDLVLCSYALNELTPNEQAKLVERAWHNTAQMLLLVEPGTQAGFQNLKRARTQLLAQGATIVAPCPSSQDCPMAACGDWCHFAARVERSAAHRRLKDGELGHEDEKFAYLALSRTTAAAAARIVRHPRIFRGYTQLVLCRDGRLENLTVTRSQKEDWRRLKHLGWGDAW